MADTYIGTNDPKAVKLFSIMLFADNIRASRMLRMLSESGKITQRMSMAKRESMQTTAGMPIVSVTDLSKKRGDRVTVDMVHNIQGKPFMGSDMAEGRGTNLSFDDQEFIIDQSRNPVKAGDKMSQQRTVHSLRMMAKSTLTNWFGRLFDNRIQVHLAGARGSDDAADWVVPLESDPDFKRIMVNTVNPPTTNRYFVAGGGTTVAALGDTDALRLEDFDVISTTLREQAFSLAPIEVSENMGDEDPLWCAIITQRQWHYLLLRAGEGTSAWRKFLADATQRRSMTNHPLFKGTCGMWNGLLIKRVNRPIRFNAGDTVKTVTSSSGAVVSSTVPTSLVVDRALIVGAQALAHVHGNANAPGSSVEGKFPIFWSEKWLDHDDKLEVLGGCMDGMGKFRFTQTDGEITDYGVAVVDSYAPDPKSTAGNSLRTALAS